MLLDEIVGPLSPTGPNSLDQQIAELQSGTSSRRNDRLRIELIRAVWRCWSFGEVGWSSCGRNFSRAAACPANPKIWRHRYHQRVSRNDCRKFPFTQRVVSCGRSPMPILRFFFALIGSLADSRSRSFPTAAGSFVSRRIQSARSLPEKILFDTAHPPSSCCRTE